MVEVVAILACTAVIIVLLVYIKDLLESRYNSRVKAAEQESVQLRSDITELQIECSKLRKTVVEMQEQIAELYIQQHDKGWIGSE